MIKIADTIESASDFPSMMAKSLNIILKDDTESSLQDAYNNGLLGGSGLPEPESKDKLLLSTENEETSELEWSQVDKSTVGDLPFKGTHDEWDALSDEEKAKYETVIFTDDCGEGGKGGVGFIDLSRKIATFTGSCNWTATENCYINLNAHSSGSTGSTRVLVDGVYLYTLNSPTAPVEEHITMPIEKGSVVEVVTYPQYIINFYGMKY